MDSKTSLRCSLVVRLAVSTAVAIVASACSVVAPPVGGGDGTPGEIGDVLADLRDGGFNGVILIETPGDVNVTAIGLADRARDLPFGPDTVVDIGSITKQFTGAAILRLQMDGKLSIDDPLFNFFPDLPEEQAAITLHQLLTHTSGLPPALGHDYEPIERQEYLELVAATRLERAPGTGYEYSNVGYSLLAAVIETVTGDTYEVYLRNALFEPADMNATGYVLPDWDDHEVAVGYDGDEALGRPNEQIWADDGPYWHLRGNGGLLSTIEDLHRWHQALLGDTVLDAEAKTQYYDRHTPEGPHADTFYGYGWAISPTQDDTWLISHNGGNGIFFADFLRFLDEGVTVIMATNAARPLDEDAALRLAGAALDFDVTSGCVPDTLDDLERIEAFPTTAAGNAAADLLAVLTEPDDPNRTRALLGRLLPTVTGGASPEAMVDEVEEVQQEFAGTTVTDRYREDDYTFHVRLEGGATPELVLSARMDETDPDRISCVEISD